MKTPKLNLKSLTKFISPAAALVVAGFAVYGLLYVFTFPLDEETKTATMAEVNSTAVDLSRYVCTSSESKDSCAKKVLSRILKLRTDFDVSFDTSYSANEKACVDNSRNREFSPGEDYRKYEAVNNPFHPTPAGPDISSSRCAPR